MRGTRRVVILFAPDDHDASLVAQRAAFAHAAAGLAERDIAVVAVAGGTVSGAVDDAAALRHWYGAGLGRFAFVLIGKDGHVADRQDRPVTPDALFARIDAMPMRREEMRTQGR